jgi:hypothetical protein
MIVAMSERIQVEAARIPDRDRVLSELEAHGIEAHAVGEVEIEVPAAPESNVLLNHVETVVFEIGEPFVPVKKDGTIYLRPPGD